jgi:hypothetical protein
MRKILIIDWEEGFDKVSFTKFQMEVLDMNLKESKKNTDRLLEGEKIILNIEVDNIATLFTKKIKEIGAICEVID